MKVLRLDVWKNALTNFGRTVADKTVGLAAQWDRSIIAELDRVYASDDIAARIVGEPVADMFRKGYELQCDSITEDDKTNIYEYMVDSGLLTKLMQCVKLGRLHGGAALVVNVVDGLDADQPINWGGIRKISSVFVATRDELTHSTIDRDPESPNFGLPAYYTFQNPHGSVATAGFQNGLRIHHSRIIRLNGDYLPPNLFIQNNYWHDSVLTKPMQAVKDFHVANHSAAVLMSDVAQAVYKVKGLADLLLQKDGKKLLQERLDTIEYARSVINAMVLDAEDEEFERKGTPLAGVPELIDRVNKRMCAAAGIPHTKLLGDSPSGLGATGRSEQADYYDRIASMQNNELRPALEYLLRVVLLAKDGPTGGVEPKKWAVTFLPLMQLSETEEADRRLKTAQADRSYIETGVLSPDEIREGRFGGDRYSVNTRVDRYDEADAAIKQAIREHVKDEE